jgi:hypothetical protein
MSRYGPLDAGPQPRFHQPDGTLLPPMASSPGSDEPGHVAFALGEFYRATGETTLKGYDLIDLAARCDHGPDVHRARGGKRPRLRLPRPPGLRSLQGTQPGLGAPGRGDPAAHRQVPAAPQRLRQSLAGLQRRQGRGPLQSFGLSKKDETSRLIERMVERINQTSSAGFSTTRPAARAAISICTG